MIAAIIQARMGSRRLPGKILKKVDGIPLLKIQCERVKRSRVLNKIIVATSDLIQDDVVEAFCLENEIECFRGEENDVLSRYYQCAKRNGVDVIVRLTADCPLVDPEIIDEVVRVYLEKDIDYVANTVPVESSTFPEGCDVEVFSFVALERAYQNCMDPNEREHVTFYFWKNENGFKTAQLIRKQDLSGYRFTVDYPEDFEVIEFILNELKKRNIFGSLEEIVSIIECNQQIKEKNSRFYSGIGWEQKGDIKNPFS